MRRAGTSGGARPLAARIVAITDLLIIFSLAALAFVALLAFGATRRGEGGVGGARGVVLAAAAAVNVAGVIGIGWFEGLTIPYDGVDAAGTAVAVVLALLLVALTVGGLWAERRGRPVLAACLLLLGALPTAAIYAVAVLFVTHPTDMR